jgi:predicted aconitase with swiveling domain
MEREAALMTAQEARIVAAAPDVVLHGRKVVGGVTEGEALVTRETISGWGGVNPMKGEVIESRHELRGVSFANKVLIFPGAKGSSGWSGVFHLTRLAGTAPLALVFNTMTTKAALGAVVLRVPTLTGLDQDPLKIVQTGDWVRVDADAGTLSIWKRPSS